MSQVILKKGCKKNTRLSKSDQELSQIDSRNLCEKGKHARAAVGIYALPSNIAVEVEVIVEIED